MRERVYFVIPAGGVGLRCASSLPKQFYHTGHNTILGHTLEAVLPYAFRCVLAVSSDYLEYTEELLREFPWFDKVTLVEAGETRFHSVRNAIQSIPEGELIAVHDAVRPSISGKTIERLLEASLEHKAVAPCKKMSDSLRMLLDEEGNSQGVERSRFVAVQTPQIFHSELIKRAYQEPFRASFTDDISVYEAFYKLSPFLVEDPFPNFKITYPEDRIYFKALLEEKK